MLHRCISLLLGVVAIVFLAMPSTFAQGVNPMMLGRQKSLGSSTLGGMGNSVPSSTSEQEGSQRNGKPELGSTGSGGIGIDVIQYQVHILGQVRGPGTYRISPSTRLDEALNKAQGISERGSLRRVEIRREGKTSHFDLFKYQKFGDLSQNPFLMDNDVVFIPYAENNVAIRGPVKDSGVFELTENDKSLWGLIQLAGGYTTGVDEKDPITVVRFNEGKKELIKVANVETELKTFQLWNGDIAIVPHLLAKNRRFDYDLVDLPADNLYIPTQKNEVFVTGAVTGGGAFSYNPAYSIRDFVNMAGPAPFAKLNSVYILTSRGKYIKSPDKKKDFRLSPGDTIIVPKRAMTTDNVLKWYNTFTGTIFTGFAFKQLLSL